MDQELTFIHSFIPGDTKECFPNPASISSVSNSWQRLRRYRHGYPEAGKNSGNKGGELYLGSPSQLPVSLRTCCKGPCLSFHPRCCLWNIYFHINTHTLLVHFQRFSGLLEHEGEVNSTRRLPSLCKQRGSDSQTTAAECGQSSAALLAALQHYQGILSLVSAPKFHCKMSRQ